MKLSYSDAGITNSIYNLKTQSSEMSQAYSKLSSGLKVNTAADAPADIGKISSVKSLIGGLQTANNNIQDGISYLQQRDSAMAQVENIMLRLRDLAVRAANDATISDAARSALQKEASSLVSTINTINEVGKFQGTKLFQKTFETVPGGNGGLVHPGQVSISMDFAAIAQGGKVEIYGAWYDGSAAFPDFNLLSPDGTEAFGYLYNTWSNPFTSGIETYIGGGGASTVNNGAPGKFGVGTMNSATKIEYSGWGGYGGSGGWDEESFVVYDPAPGLWTIIIDNEQPVPKQYGLFFNEAASDPLETIDEVFVGSDIYDNDASIFNLGAYEISSTALGLGANFSSATSSASSIESIDNALKKLADHRANDGTNINILSSILDDNNTQILNSETTKSNVEDTDFAETTTEHVKTQILSQSSNMAMKSQADSRGGFVDLIYQAGIGKGGSFIDTNNI